MLSLTSLQADKIPTQSTMIGGQRMAPRKRAQSETNTAGTRTNMPVNSGFQRYYGFATSSIQMGPQAVLLLAIIYMGAVVVMHIVSRIKTSI
ncbi:hypothetical protein, conserved [Babesia bigemina]|uniref:Protein transport protein Sec61 subunit beta n=1 Tax=Babesia bigemina TaxID=5866 RepID=A0A061D9E1_BABBI|nr:hypothetical protein, conserved [Babesia bigemina]CDR94315.1 hypothetical protein, conserved [Babesia bigemina]|eukprot:XP_012766501.1 hypothetical protein, conserved [Babesia bigemina]